MCRLFSEIFVDCSVAPYSLFAFSWRPAERKNSRSTIGSVIKGQKFLASLITRTLQTMPLSSRECCKQNGSLRIMYFRLSSGLGGPFFCINSLQNKEYECLNCDWLRNYIWKKKSARRWTAISFDFNSTRVDTSYGWFIYAPKDMIFSMNNRKIVSVNCNLLMVLTG